MRIRIQRVALGLLAIGVCAAVTLAATPHFIFRDSRPNIPEHSTEPIEAPVFADVALHGVANADIRIPSAFGIVFGDNASDDVRIQKTSANTVTVTGNLSCTGATCGGGGTTPVAGTFQSSLDPPLFQNYTLTTTGAQTSINLTATPLDTHTISWRPSGTVTTCTVALDTSPDNSTWTAGGAIAGQACTSAGQASVQALNANYIRVNLTTLTGGGTLTVVYSGRLSPPPVLLASPNPTITVQSGLMLQQGFDTFTRANASTLGTNWTNANQFQIASNTAEPAATGSVETAMFAAAPGQTWPQDQCARATIAARANNNTYGGPGVRMILATQTSSLGGTAYFWGAFNGSGNAQIWRYTGGGATSLVTGSAIATGVPYTLCVQGQPPPFGSGVVLNGYKNGVLDATVTDTTVTVGSGGPAAISGGLYGIVEFATTAVGDIQLTNFAGGPIINTPTSVNAGGVTTVLVLPNVNTTLGSFTAANQDVQFVISQAAQRTLGRLQMVVSPGASASNNSVINPVWSLLGSQDGGQSWWAVPAVTMPTGTNMGGQPGSIYAQWYDITGLTGNTIFQFVLVSGTVNGSLSAIATIG